MTTPPIESCVEIGKSIRLGKIYPTALEIVDAIEAATGAIDPNSPESLDAAKMIRETTIRQLNQDWLGVADFLQYDLPEFIKNIISTHN